MRNCGKFMIKKKKTLTIMSDKWLWCSSACIIIKSEKSRHNLYCNNVIIDERRERGSRAIKRQYLLKQFFLVRFGLEVLCTSFTL